MTAVAVAPLSSRDRWVSAAALSVGSAILICRLWSRLAHPGIFAEDGVVFYAQAVDHPWASVFQPYAGYVHLLPRLIALTVSPFGVTAVPVAYTWIAVLTLIGSMALVLSPRMQRLLPNVWIRATAFIALTLNPQIWETAAVVASLIFVGGIALALIGLSEQPVTRAGRTAELVAVAVLGLSGPLIVFGVPLFVFRWWQRRTRHNLRLSITAAAAATTQLVVLFAFSTRSAGAGGSFRDLPRVYTQRVAGELLGSASYSETAFIDHTGFRWVAALWLLLVLVLVVGQLRLPALVVLVSSGAALAWAVRVYGAQLIYPTTGDRHILVPTAVLVVLLVAATGRAVAAARIRPGAVTRLIAAAGVSALAATVLGITQAFVVPGYVHVPTAQQLADFETCISAGRTDCPSLEISPDYFAISNADVRPTGG